MKTPIHWVLMGFGFVSLHAILMAWMNASALAGHGYASSSNEASVVLLLAMAVFSFATALWMKLPWRRLWRRWMGWALIWMAIAVIVFAVAMAIYDHTCAVRRRAAESPAGRMERALETGTYETGIPARWPGRPVADPYAGIAEPSR